MKRILENTLAEEAHCHSRCCAFMFFFLARLARFAPTQNCRGVTYSRPSTGTGMPSQERFRARPMWACLEPCPVSRNYQFRGGQQPKPQICGCFSLHGLLPNVRNSITNNHSRQARFSIVFGRRLRAPVTGIVMFFYPLGRADTAVRSGCLFMVSTPSAVSVEGSARGHLVRFGCRLITLLLR
jgi:hypothetical protein